jgi:hypothetical protein
MAEKTDIHELYTTEYYKQPYRTRHIAHTEGNAPDGCRDSAYIYICLSILYHLHVTRDMLIYTYKKTILPELKSNSFFNDPTLHIILDENIAQTTQYTPITIDRINYFDEPKIYMMALVHNIGSASHNNKSYRSDDSESKIGTFKHIPHYFLIENTGTELYVLSSWGSHLVCIKQYKTLLDKGELTRFIHGLSSSDMSVKEPNISFFMKKYFLNDSYGKTIPVDLPPDELGDIRPIIDNVLGANDEIQSIIIDTTYELVCLHNVVDIFEASIKDITGMSGGIKKRKTQIKKRKTQRKKRKTQRNIKSYFF